MKRIGTATLSSAIVVASAVGLTSVNAQTPEETVEQRQEHMRVFGNAMRVTGAYVREDAATIEEVQAAVMPAAALAPDILSWFPEGTGVGVGDSAALPIIWEQWDDFTEAANTASQAIVAFEEVVALGDPANIAAAMAQAGRTCGACHDVYQADDN